MNVGDWGGGVYNQEFILFFLTCNANEMWAFG